MSFNGSGTFVINSAGQPVVSGTVISSTAFNALTADLANGLSTCITKDGQTTPTADIPMGSNKITGLGSGTAAGDAANLGQVQSTVAKLLGSVSGADTITAVGSPTVAAYAAGQMFYFVAAGANTGAVTINIDSLGAKSITRDGTTALAAGDIQSGEVCVIVYDGTQFQLVNGASQSAAIVTNSLTVNGTSSLDGAVTINDSGADVDFRVEGDTDANLLFVDASTDRVGVGTNTPAAKVDVQKSDGSGRQDLMRILAGGNSNGNGATLALGSTQTQAGYISGLQTASNEGALVFGVQSSGAYAERARIDSAGNLGLGVTPSAWSGGKAIELAGTGLRASLFMSNSGVLALSQNYYFNGGADIYAANGFATRYYQLNGQHVWNIAPSGTADDPITFTQAMTLDASGNLLLGTTTGTNAVATLGNNNGGSGFGYQKYSAFFGTNLGGAINPTNSWGLSIGWNRSSGGGESNIVYGTGSGSTPGLAFASWDGTTYTERARITAGGEFLAGTTSASSPGGVPTFHEFKTSADNKWVVSANHSTASQPWGIAVDYTGAAPNTSSYHFFYAKDTSAARFLVRSDGGISNYQANDSNLSDERVKKDITPLGSMWDKLKAIEIVTFKYKDQTHDDDNIGVIAQQVESVAPEFVDVDGFGETPEDGAPLKLIYTADMYHAAIKALQEAMTRIEALEAEVAALKGAN